MQSSAAYRALFGIVLRKRAARLFFLSFLASFLLLISFFILNPHNPFFSFSFFFFFPLYSLLISLLAAIPLISLKRSYILALPQSSNTRYNHLFFLFCSTRFLYSLAFFSSSALLIALAYRSFSVIFLPDSHLSWSSKLPARDIWHCNERPIFLIFGALTTAFIYSVDHVYNERVVVSNQTLMQYKSIPSRLYMYSIARFKSVICILLTATLAVFPAYNAIRRVAVQSIIYSRYSTMRTLRIQLIGFVRKNLSFTLSLNLRLFALNLLIIALWEIIQILWDVYYTQPFAVSQYSPFPNKCLLDGIKSTDPVLQHFAFLELAQISWSDPERRVSIFTDIKGPIKVFPCIAQECLAFLENTRLSIQNRGQVMESKEPNSLPLESKRDFESLKSTPIRSALIKTDLPNVFSASPPKTSLKKSILTKLLTSNEPEVNSSTLSSSTPTQSANPNNHPPLNNTIPDIFRPPESKFKPLSASSSLSSTIPLTSSVIKPKNPVTRQKKELIIPFMIKKLLVLKFFQKFERKGYWEDWFFRPVAKVEVLKSLGRYKTCILSAESLSNFVCGSLKEDAYGVTQDLIPQILEGFVACLMTVEEFAEVIWFEYAYGEPSQSSDKTPQSTLSNRELGWNQEVEKTLSETVQPLIDRLYDGLRGMVKTFQPYLKEWNLSPKTTRFIESRLQLES